MLPSYQGPAQADAGLRDMRLRADIERRQTQFSHSVSGIGGLLHIEEKNTQPILHLRT